MATIHVLPQPRSWRAEALVTMGRDAPLEGEDSADWLQAALTSGQADIQIRLGAMLLTGEGLPADRRAAFACFLAAAGSGNAQALNLLGRCHENGWGTATDREAARHCYRLAAEKGDYCGAHNYGCVLATDGCIAGALRWFMEAVGKAPPDARSQILQALRQHPRCAVRAFAAHAT